MNITLQTTDKINGTITAVVEPADYQEEVKKSIKELRKNANIPGFRKGMVPEGLIRKRFGTSVLAEEVNKVLQNKLYDYIRDNKVNMLGELLPTEENNSIELVDGNTFTFTFDIALAPEMNVSLSAEDKIPYYVVKADETEVKRQVDIYRQRGGNYEKVESYEDNDMVKGTIEELALDGTVLEGGVKAENAVMLPKYFKNEEQKALFATAKVNEVITFNPATAYDNSEVELSSLLKIDREDALNHKGDFQFTVNEITRYVPGPLNQELFDQVFPGEGITTAEQFEDKIRKQVEEQWAKNADMKFMADLHDYLMEKVGPVEFPDEKLKRVMLAKTKDEKKVEDDYQKNIDALKWHLIKEQLVEQHEVKVEDDDVMEAAREMTRMQFAQYGMLNIPSEYIENSATEMLKRQENIDMLIDRSIEAKLTAILKKVVTLEKKEVSSKEFGEL